MAGRFAVWLISMALVLLLTQMPAPQVEAMFGCMRPFQIVPGELLVDSIPPTTPAVDVRSISRGYGGFVDEDGHSVFASESKYAMIQLKVSGSQDDRTPADSLGYRFMFVDGQLPEGCQLPSDTFLADLSFGPEQTLCIIWNDGRDWTQDAFHFTIRVAALDRAGNESPPSNAVVIEHDGTQEERRKQMAARFKQSLQRFHQRNADTTASQ